MLQHFDGAERQRSIHPPWRRPLVERAPLLTSLSRLKAPLRRRGTPSPFARCQDQLPPALLVAELRRSLWAAGGTIRRRFAVHGDGLRAAREQSDLVDDLVLHLLALGEQAVHESGGQVNRSAIAIAATGGYGRAELAPHSDIDLLFLVRHRSPNYAVLVIESVLYRLWDMGLQVGHAVRTVGECVDLARVDWRSGVSLLDLRFLGGAKDLYDGLTDRLRDALREEGATLRIALLHDLAKRHARFVDPSAPDVKRCRGGLRDLQTLLWLGKISRQIEDVDHVSVARSFQRHDAVRHADARRFLWSVRRHLHDLAGRVEDRLSPDLQGEVARRMTPEQPSPAAFMRQFRRVTEGIAGASACWRQH